MLYRQPVEPLRVLVMGAVAGLIENNKLRDE